MSRQLSGAYPAAALCALMLTLVALPTEADSLVLLVQPPVLDRDARAFDARPLAAVLSRVLDRTVTVRVSDDVLSHWQTVLASPDYDLAFDEAHFTDYRIRRHGFTALLKDAVDVRFQVLVRPRTLITGPSDLAARLVASPAPPSLGAVRLMALFPRVTRAPRLRVVASRGDALSALATGVVDAALLPADAGGGRGEAVPALVTDVSPGRALSVSGAIPDDRRNALIRELVGYALPGDVRQALSSLGIGAFESASNEVYEDSERLLRGTWGYR